VDLLLFLLILLRAEFLSIHLAFGNNGPKITNVLLLLVSPETRHGERSPHILLSDYFSNANIEAADFFEFQTTVTSQKPNYVSAREPNRLTVFGETVAVYCENHTEHTDTVRTSWKTHYVFATETNPLMLFRESVAVYCEKHTELTDTVRTSWETHYVSAT
jgi:hypothetical protein